MIVYLWWGVRNSKSRFMLCFTDLRMIGLSKINQLYQQVTVKHYIIWLEVEMNDSIISNISQSLKNGEAQEYFRYE